MRIDLVHSLVYPGVMQFNIHEAKTHLSRLLERVQLGEEITISKAGRPIARLIPLPSRQVRRKTGSAAGEFRVPADFDDPLPDDVEQSFWR